MCRRKEYMIHVVSRLCKFEKYSTTTTPVQGEGDDSCPPHVLMTLT
jgi:hypothetical protein